MIRAPGAKSLRKTTRWLRSRFSHRALILGYHRVAEADSDPNGLCVSPQRFAEQLEILRRRAQPVPLHQLARSLQTGTTPQRAVALTFDDGYVDVLQQAYPLLEEYQVPATVFVVTGCLGGSFAWDVTEHKTQDTIQARALTRQELSQLAGKPLIEVGAHTVSHPPLAKLPAAEQRLEIEECKKTVEEILGQPVRGFSYPHGSTSGVTRNLVRKAGYEYACSSFNDVALSGSDLFHLPRFWPQNWDGDRFNHWLSWWLGH